MPWTTTWDRTAWTSSWRALLLDLRWLPNSNGRVAISLLTSLEGKNYFCVLKMF
jgi:hypothetical protein